MKNAIDVMACKRTVPSTMTPQSLCMSLIGSGAPYHQDDLSTSPFFGLLELNLAENKDMDGIWGNEGKIQAF